MRTDNDYAKRQSRRRCRKCSDFYITQKGERYFNFCPKCRVVSPPPAVGDIKELKEKIAKRFYEAVALPHRNENNWNETSWGKLKEIEKEFWRNTYAYSLLLLIEPYIEQLAKERSSPLINAMKAYIGSDSDTHFWSKE